MMKNYGLIIGLLVLIQFQIQAQTSILAARSLTTGTSVTLRGVVTNGPELDRIRYFQDGTAGIGAFFSSTQLTTTPVNVGDSILVTGNLLLFSGLLEISPVTSYTIVANNRPLPTPVSFNLSNATAAWAEQYEGMLVRINGLSSVSTSALGPVTAFAGNTNYKLNGDTKLEFRVNTKSDNTNLGSTDGIVGKSAPSTPFDIVGVMSQFGTSGPAKGYQLLPRLYSDFILQSIGITSPISVSNISKTSLNVNFVTNIPGNSIINYGITTTLGTTVTDANLTQNHSVQISGLSPATIYYVSVTSTATSGTATSQIVPIITESNSSGNIKAYFTSRVNNTYANPSTNKAIFLNRSADDTLIAYINRAKQKLDIAIYNWNNTNLSDITAAVNNAYNRGVEVRIVYDGSTNNLALNSLNGAIGKVASPQGSSPAGGNYQIMHNKFVIIDANSTDANDSYVWTGATNWTDDQMNLDRNNVIIIQDQSVAKAYTIEFEEMFGSKTLTPGVGKFANNKKDNTPHQFKVGGKPLEVYFSPSDGTSQKIIDAINSANSSFQFAQLVTTRSDITNAIRSKSISLGTNTNCPLSIGLLNDTANASSAYFTMQGGLKTQLRIKPATSPDTILHHKYLIVDSELPSSDPIVLTGSHNWSNNGENYNDENTVVIHDAAIANQFYQEFAKIYSVYGGGTLCNSIITDTQENQLATYGFSVYPNPATSELNIKFAQSEGKIEVSILDLSGKIVISEQIENGNLLNVSKLNPGLYLTKLKNGSETKFEKIIIE